MDATTPTRWAPRTKGSMVVESRESLRDLYARYPWEALTR